MENFNISILRKYQRKSKSPFENDDSTILLLAERLTEKERIILNYRRYIYLHRDELGRWLGISISKSVEDEKADGGGRYREGIHALSLLLDYHSEIKEFLAHFSDEIEALFGLDSETWLMACKARWRKLVK